MKMGTETTILAFQKPSKEGAKVRGVTQNFADVVAVLGDLTQPPFHVHKGLGFGHVVNDDDAVRVPVVPAERTHGRS